MTRSYGSGVTPVSVTADLHMHTVNSDGSFTTEQLLKRAEGAGLGLISITDHNKVGAYRDMEKKLPDGTKVRDIFKGRIIKGIEITAHVNGYFMEILGYGIDVDKMEKLIKGYPQERFQEDFFKEKTIENLRKLGFNFGEVENLPVRDIYIYLTKNKKFCDKVNPKMYLNSISYIFRSGVINKKSPLFCDTTGYLKSAREVVDIIHKCGGLAFVAHPGEYLDDNFDMVLQHCKDFVDGIECFHPSHDIKMREQLVKFANDNNLLISGGSDFHGKLKPHIELGVGTGDLVVPKDLLTWL